MLTYYEYLPLAYLVVEVAERARHTEHHLAERAALGRDQHGSAIAALRLEAAPEGIVRGGEGWW
eukprot:scaffold64853_cov65-Phaeocystis_antarctica.AAC.5